jgi:hypothetical protein
MITEGKMSWGSFNIPLKRNTPGNIIHMLNRGWYGNIKIHSASVDVATTAAPKYTGVVLDRPDPYTIGGCGPYWYLGEASSLSGFSESGPVSTTKFSQDGVNNGSLNDWLAYLFAIIPTGLTPVYHSMAATPKYPGTFHRRTMKSALDSWLCIAFAKEYRILPNFLFWMDTDAALWPFNDPKPLAVRKGGRDLNVIGLNDADMAISMSVRDLASGGMSVGIDPETGIYEVPMHSVAYNIFWNFKLPDGTALQRTVVEDSSNSGNIDTTAKMATKTQQEANRIRNEHQLNDRKIDVSTTEYDITKRVLYGGWLLVYDVEQNIYDLTNPVLYQGRTIYPAKLRVEEITWPVMEGMTVIFDNTHNVSGQKVDLTRYVDWNSEGDNSTIIVGAPPFMLGARRRR